MPGQVPDEPSTIIPSFRYREAHAAIDWLCRAFGFERHGVYDDAWGARMVLPSQLDGRQTHGCNIIVEDADAVYASAKAAGAEIVDELADLEYGGRGFSCRDPEGYLWWVGTYDPWATH